MDPKGKNHEVGQRNLGTTNGDVSVPPFLWARDPGKRYNKSAGKHTFADYCLFFVRREINKYLIDSYINSRDVYHLFPLWAAVYCVPSFIFFCLTPFVQTYIYFVPSMKINILLCVWKLLKYLLQVHFRRCSKTCVHFLLCKKKKKKKRRSTTTVYSSNNLCGITGVKSMGSLTKDRREGECVRLGVLWV